jgi:hypothetical protein
VVDGVESVCTEGYEHDQADRGDEEDGHPRRAATIVNPGEHRGQHPLICHAVGDPGGHDQVDERPVGDRQKRDGREELGRDR